jgi:hypothetical protein
MWQQAIALLLDHGIALAAQPFQRRPIEYRDFPAGITDDAELPADPGESGATVTKAAKRSVVGERDHRGAHARANDSRRRVDDHALAG